MPAHTGVESSPLSRRAFVGAAAGAAASLLVGRARAEDTFVVGLVLPPASDAGALEQGARLGLEEANALATLFGKRLRMESETAADAGAAGRAATAMVRAGALALVGGAGNGYADALRDAAATGNALFLNTAARDDRLRQERCDKHTFHVIPGITMYVDALAQWAASRQLMRWAIFGDGTPRAQEVEAAVRRALTRHAGASLAADRSSADLLIL
ncbi:MAG TPA: ABC transporter substrate-binding protein, partial [Candidatus Methylomirabilis sp.]|nr:ABC transporter substrate-binding protein [Candidatus Methylomirabilis sp.]